MSGVCSIWHIHHPRGQVTLGALIVLVSPNPWQMKFAKCAASPSSLPRMRYGQCAVSPSSLLRDEVYPVCGEPLIPSKDEVYPVCSEPLIPRLPSVQWAPHPWHCLRLTDEVYTVCSGPLIPSFPWKMRLTQCATSLSSILRMRFSQCAVGPSSLTEPERWSLPSVQPAPHP